LRCAFLLDSSQADTHLFNTNVVMLGVDASDLSLTTGSNTFSYQIFADTNVDEVGVQDSTPWLTYSVAKPGISFQSGLFGLPTFADLSSTSKGSSYMLSAIECLTPNS
jgi:hypothetical protein